LDCGCRSIKQWLLQFSAFQQQREGTWNFGGKIFGAHHALDATKMTSPATMAERGLKAASIATLIKHWEAFGVDGCI